MKVPEMAEQPVRSLKPLPDDKTKDNPLVSVIVPTLNSERTLEGCLQSLRKQTWRRLETIVVDGFSRDRSVMIARAHADAVLQQRGERSEARNTGARVARGDLLVFIDSDMYLAPNVLKECASLAQGTPACAIIVPELGRGEGFWAACRALEKRCTLGDPRQEAARAFTRAAWDLLGGFDASLGPAGEDWDLTLRARERGIPIVRTQSPVEHDEGHISLRQSALRKFYYGTHISKYVAKHRNVAKTQLLLLRPAYVRNRRLLAELPVTATGMFVLKGVELFAGWLGYHEGRERNAGRVEDLAYGGLSEGSLLDD